MLDPLHPEMMNIRRTLDTYREFVKLMVDPFRTELQKLWEAKYGRGFKVKDGEIIPGDLK